MRAVYSIILIVSFSILTGCSHLTRQQATGLPSLNDQRSFKVVQVAANFNPETRHDFPYFILCDSEDCPQITPKTPLRVVSLNASRTEHESSTELYQQSGRSAKDRKPIKRPRKNQNALSQFTTHFEYASATVSDYYQSLLRRFFDDYPHQQRTLRVTGFTDSTSIPDGEIPNEWLALERAVNVKNHLIFLGYPQKKILLEAKYLCCYIASNKNEQDRRLNRRAEINLK